MLLERDRALAGLDELLADTAAGRGGAAVIGGVIGSGKTALLAMLIESAQNQGMLVLRAGGVRAERSVKLGLLSQLLHDAPLPPESARHLHSLVEAAAVARDRNDPLAPLPSRLLHAVNALLLELVAQGPVLITVDDVHWGDPGSLQCLLHLLRRVRSAPVLVAFAESTHAAQANPLFHIGLLREPRCRWLHAEPLSAAAVGELTGAREQGAELHRFSGGNPLLLRALVADWGRAPSGGVPPEIAETYGQAVLSCLYRAQPAMRSVARGLAVFGGPVPVPLLGRLLHEPAGRVTEALDELAAAGLLHDGYFRHPAAARAVLGNLSEARARALHRRAAELLHQDGRPAPAVARHLLAAYDPEPSRPDGSQSGSMQPAWARDTLCDAAEAARSDDDLELAVRCLALAAEGCPDPSRLAEITLALAETQWRLNPAAAASHLPELHAALRSGDLSERHASTVVRMLLWHGRVADAEDVLAGAGTDAGAGWQAARAWARLTAPGLVPAAGQPGLDSPALGGLDPAGFGPAILNTVLARGGDAATSAAAERLLAEAEFDERCLGSLEAGLYALLYADQLQSAARFGSRLAELATGRDAPGWHARLAVVQAEISLRRGDLPAAERHARHALDRLPRRAWGAVAGAPLAALLLALTGAGRLREAEQVLAEPVPESLFETRFGILYSYARGQFKLASGRPWAAIQEFRACGRQLRSWDIDLPSFVPWRGAAAVGHVLTDDTKGARKLIEAQLARPGATAPRSYGISMRQLAAASSARDRPRLLREAIENLQAAGDRLELAHALADLSRAHEALGETKRAQAMTHQALKLARECHADPLARSLQRRQAEPVPAHAVPEIPDPGVLSEAERRVAELASMGYTNREVADSLFITVSTVEQHLTRIYRKLNLSGRSDLSMTGSLWAGNWVSAERRENGA
ncbi:MAG TPA: AAA family ATPase [Jatrophihabitans sp.]|nr:AAA family ATPase [Jatrophihabitans sp.]